LTALRKWTQGHVIVLKIELIKYIWVKTRDSLTQFGCYKPRREAIHWTVYESIERTRIMTRHTEYERSVSYQRLLEDPLKWGGKWIAGKVIYGLYLVILLVLFIVYYYVVRPWLEE
jgi:predicted Fe-S protein YdhL (DUF1289 family)